MRYNYYLTSLALLVFFSVQQAFGQSDTVTHTYDVLNYKLFIDLSANYEDPFPMSFAANEVITLEADSTISAIILNASATSLTIDSVSEDATSFSQSTDTLNLTLKKTFHPGETVLVKIYYHHKDKIDLAFYSGSKYVFTDCEPEGARHWFPCWDKPSDKATTDITAKVPSIVQLASNGTLVDSTAVGDTVYYHWVSRDPMATYLVALASRKKYNVDVFYWHPNTHPNDSIPVRFYYAPGETPFHIESVYSSMLTYQSDLFGDYPFEKVGFASVSSVFQSVGMENQTIIIFCPNCWYEWLTFHELTHHWFGDLITPKTWADIWLNEGFAQYSQVLWAEHTEGSAQARDTVESYRDYYLSANPGWPIYDSSWAVKTPSGGTLFNYAITYCKGACVVDQLRYVLGDSAFFGLLKAYTTSDQFRFKNASVGDFMNFTNNFTGGNYDWFFNEWLMQPNHPVYFNTTTINPNGSEWEVTEKISQIQSNAPFFQMPVELQINFSDGSDSVYTVMNDANHQIFAFTFLKQVKSVTFDPNDRILLKEIGTTTGIVDPLTSNAWCFISPNPAKENTTVNYNVEKSSAVAITIYNAQGQPLQQFHSSTQNTGWHRLDVDCRNLTPGIYYCKIQLANQTALKKMEVIK